MKWSEATNKSEWNKLVNHPLQSWEWGDFRASSGVKVQRILVFQNKKLIPLQTTYHRLGKLPLTIGYSAKGPKMTKEILSCLQESAQPYKAISILLEPNVFETDQPPVSFPGLAKAHRGLFTKYSFILDLNKSEEALLGAMHPKTRYNIGLAQRHGVIINEDNSDTAFETYLGLTCETTRRQGFYAHSPDYHRRLWKYLKPAKIAKIFTATYKKQIVAAWMVFLWKDTVYYPYGASERAHKNVMAPNLLAWEVIRWGKKQGYKLLDLWGALPPNPDPNDPWYGFHKFKQGYGPNHVSYAGSFDLVLNRFWYPLYTASNDLRWKVLSLRRGGRR